MRQSVEEIITHLNEADKQTLIKLYHLRCLSIEQIYQLYYCQNTEFKSFVQKNISELVRLKLIKLSNYRDNE